MGLLTATPLACSGHVLIDLPIFMGPVVVLAGWLLMTTRRARRRERLEDGAAAPDAASSTAHIHERLHDRDTRESLLGVHA